MKTWRTRRSWTRQVERFARQIFPTGASTLGRAALLLAVCLILPVRAKGQGGFFAGMFGTWVTVDPAGACTNNQPMQYNTSNGNLWGCDSGTWTKINVAAGVTGSGTTGTIAKWTGATAIGNSSFLTESVNFLSSSGPVDLTTKSLVIERPNNGITGTTLNLLAKFDASANAIVLTTSASDQTAAIGCVIGGAGTTGSAQIGILGQFNCDFDNTPTTAGDFIIVSGTTAGTLHDTGSSTTYPTSGEVLGTVQTTNAACGAPPCGPYAVTFMTPDVAAAGSGSGGGGGKIANANAGDVAVYTGKNAIGGVASDNLFFDTTNQRLGVNFGNAPPAEGSFKYKSANTTLGVPVLVLDNAATTNALDEIDFRTSSGTTQAMIAMELQNNNLVIDSDVQGTNNAGIVLSTFDRGASQSGRITIATNIGASGVNALPAGWIALNASQGSAGIYIQSGTNVTVGANGTANISTDIDGIDLWEAGSGKPGLRLRNGVPGAVDTVALPFEITNTTINGPTVLASFGPLAQPASSGATPGTNETAVFTLTGGGGGNTTIATTGVGGNAGNETHTFGAGGTANSVTGANNATGGNGGGETHTMGNGANVTATDTGTNTGGNGGGETHALGSGGTAANGSVNNSGKDGTYVVKAGARANADIFEWQNNAGTVLSKIDQTGQVNGVTFGTATNCSSAAAPAVCGSAAAGSVVVAAGATTVVVNTTAVTANSQIFLTYDSSLGTKLSVTCNTTEPALYGVTARSAGTSFTITASSPITNPACFSYLVVN